MELLNSDIDNLYAIAKSSAKRAGEYIASQRRQHLVVNSKSSGSSLASQVVTDIDIESQRIIEEALLPTLDRYSLGFLGEESQDNSSRSACDYFWCVDPLDGTLPFINGDSGFSVSIALVSKSGEAILGVIYDPVEGKIFHARVGEGAYLSTKENSYLLSKVDGSTGSKVVEESFRFVVDRSFIGSLHFESLNRAVSKLSSKLGVTVELIGCGGAAMNACWLLEAKHGCYLKLSKSAQGGGSVWDFAASSIIFREAGAISGDMWQRPLNLNPEGSTFMNRRGVLFATDRVVANYIREYLEQSALMVEYNDSI